MSADDNIADEIAREYGPIKIDESFFTHRPGDTERAGSKLDYGKAPVWQGFLNYFPRAIMAVAMVSEYGKRKYGEWGGFRRVPDALLRYADGQARHELLQSIEGPYDDSDSGLAHLAQDAWNAMARLDMALEQGVIESRRGNDIADGKPVLGTARRVT